MIIDIVSRRLAPYRLLGVLLLVLAVCGRRAADRVVARVNGRPITSAELAAVLPWSADSAIGLQVVPKDSTLVRLARPTHSARGEDGTRQRALDDLIAKELFVQEATRQGLDKDVTYQLELDKKACVTQELYNSVVAKAGRLTQLELQAAYRLLGTECHVQLIEVAEESLARRVTAELARGVPFETLAVRYSRDRSGPAGGDWGYVPELTIDEPLRSAVLGLKPGEWTRPVKSGTGYQLVRLVDRRPADPPPPPFGELKQELEFRLQQQRRRVLANEYLAGLKQRLEYNPAGLDILCKPVDSIGAEEQEEWVAIRDRSKYVKVGRLLHIARKFPASLDTALRKYTLRREIEEDLLYEDGLARGLDRLPAVKKQLERRRKDLLYQALYKKEITDRVAVSDDEVRSYYEQHRDNYPDVDLEGARSVISQRLFTERRDRRAEEFTRALRSQATIAIDAAALAAVPFRAAAQDNRGKPKESR